ncbi:hypothetical protein NDU88_002237 [Pleurodeles waltl]|uniref:Uncharacterized protein n=1 Tax=Pleurodeles waltl TaxID=8319 RepID=A0AAV7UWE6_PLEWA|nr:hypothetical protein NDU88_002237 [Pleurodeles waltl]
MCTPPEETRHGPTGPHSRALMQPRPPTHATTTATPTPAGPTGDLPTGYAPRGILNPGLTRHCKEATEPSTRREGEGAPCSTTTRGCTAIRGSSRVKLVRRVPDPVPPPRSACRLPLQQVSQQCLWSPPQLDVSPRKEAAPTSAGMLVPVGEMSNVGSYPAEPHKVAPICRTAKPRPSKSMIYLMKEIMMLVEKLKYLQRKW